VLAVGGIQRLNWHLRIPRARLVGALAIAVGTIPANAYALGVAHQFTDPTPGNANFITRDERDALTYLSKDPVDGGVLTQFYLGEVVPARTGRHTFVGDCLWSEPNCMPRSLAADALFDGSLSAAQSQSFVRQSRARFLLFSCSPGHANLERKLAPVIASVKHFGCATVYELTPPGGA
jgi:hypothetical protein